MTALRHKAQKIIKSTICCDLHACMPIEAADQFLPQLRRYLASGFDFIHLNVGWDIHPSQHIMDVIAYFRTWIDSNPDFQLADSIASVEAARQSGKLAIAFDIEGMDALDQDLARIELYYKLGVRWMLLAYNKNNSAGGGCQDHDTGLTEFGKEAIAEMERVGMVLCCSHVGRRTALEAISISSNPIIFSHSNASAVWPHARNIDDDLISMCASKGGVIGVNGIGRFLGNNDNRVETLLRHILYIIDLVGPDHVALGLDYVFDVTDLLNHVARHPDIYPPEQFKAGYRMVAPERLPDIVEGLLSRGYGDNNIRAILGENFLRVARAVWKLPGSA